MNANLTGSQALLHTLEDCGIELCFANPGTSEMHFVAAMDGSARRMRGVLALFEGVATGAADGYYRMRGHPACTLLHLGPGLANGLANLHNAKKATSGIVNVVGDHATYHRHYDAPLSSDIESIARPMSTWLRTSSSSAEVAADGVEAVAHASGPAGGIATLILPADVSWSPGASLERPLPTRSLPRPTTDDVRAAASALAQQGDGTLILLGAAATRGENLERAGRIAAKTGARLMVENLTARIERGQGRVAVQRLPYAMAAAREALSGFQTVVLIGAGAPVGFFAYPGKDSVLTAPDAKVIELVNASSDIAWTLDALDVELGSQLIQPSRTGLNLPESPCGGLSPSGIAAALAFTLPEDAVVVDESVTLGRLFGATLQQARRHDYLNSCGGSIGFGLPLALGAALAAPDRRVVALEGDGSAMYTPQALWSMAREAVNVTVVIFSNRSYEILRNEFDAVGAGQMGPGADALFSLRNPVIRWISLAASLGIDACEVSNLEELTAALQRSFSTPGPFLIDVSISKP